MSTEKTHQWIQEKADPANSVSVEKQSKKQESKWGSSLFASPWLRTGLRFSFLTETSTLVHDLFKKLSGIYVDSCMRHLDLFRGGILSFVFPP